MSLETRSTDAKGRVSLPKAFANATVIIEQVNENELRIRRARVIPEDEIRFSEEAPVVLSDRERERFLQALDHPPKPNAALRRLMAGKAKNRGEWRIERLDHGHVRDGFDCGKPSLNDFVQALVSQYEKRNLGRSYVALKEGDQRVLGYYTLASGAITAESLPAKQAKKLPGHAVPVVLLARLAVDRSVHGRGLGGFLLRDALTRSLDLSEKLGIHAVVVDALDAEAKAFYERFGFLPLTDDEMRHFLLLSTIRSAAKP